MERIVDFLSKSGPLQSAVIATALALLLALVVMAVVGFVQGREVSFWPPRIGPRPPRTPLSVEPALANVASTQPADFLKRGYSRSQHPDFFAEVERLVPQAKRITLVATGLNLIWEKHLLDLMFQRAKAGDAEVTICLGNPFSPHVEDRLIEEETRDNRPPVGREGILKNVAALVERLAKAGNPRQCRVLLFEHYPTMATLVFDEDIFFYPYAYQVLGNLSPIFHLNNDGGEVASFFIHNMERIVRDAVPAEEVLKGRRSPGQVSPSWIAAAVYAIPQLTDPFYELGSSILGYDIRNERNTEPGPFSDLRKYVGDARPFGLHATIADALFFATESAVDRVEAELRMLTKDFSPFVFSGLRVVHGIDERGDIVVRCKDDSGTCEAIHHEMVSRVYGMAISSYYISGGGGDRMSRLGKRDALMMHRYGAPFIFDRFRLHFTLLANPPADPVETSNATQTIEKEMARLESDKVMIQELVLVTMASDGLWRIRERFPLTRE